MHNRVFTIIGWALVLTFVGCGDGILPKDSESPDFKFIDSYLVKMPQGGGAMSVNDDQTQLFRKQLAIALSQKDNRAPGRLVFYSVRSGVDGRGFIPYESEIGRACSGLFAEDVPLVMVYPGTLVFTEADIYFWWDRHKAEYEAFPPYDAWRESEHVKKTVISMYESARTK